MAKSFPYLHLLMFFIIVLLSLVMPCYGADPSPLQDYCIADLSSDIYLNGYPCKNPNNVTVDDFFYDGFITDTTAFNIDRWKAAAAHVDFFPAVNTLGVTMIQIQLLKGGVVGPHTHPRASEMLLLMEGKVIAGFITTDNVLFYKTMTPKMLVVIPQAFVHFVYNVGEGAALLYASYNSQQPGTHYLSHALFNSTPTVPDDVLSRSFRVNDSIIELLKSSLSVPLYPDIMSSTSSGSVRLK
ncbi:germin-like protein 1-1 [Coffea arabica]|uniref:Germin-like protein n=2 Tax=Coffea arabica TaxID=13443 RepID=A0A6P6X3F7_COFAR